MKNKVLTFLLSLAISFGLWLYVVTVISPEYETTVYNVPVELVGSRYLDAKNLIVVSDTDDLRVDLTLSGNRSDLKKFNNNNITVFVDMSQLAYAGEHQLDYSVSFQSGTAEVVGQNPAQISVTVAEKLTKTVPVEITYIGAVPDGYEAERLDVELDHTTVTVSGPKKTIDKIAYAKIAVDVTGKMTGFASNYPLTLCSIDGRAIADDSFVTTNLNEVRASVEVYRIKKVPIDFAYDYRGSGLQEDMVTVHASTKLVTLIGSDDDLEKAPNELVFTIELKKYTQASTEIFLPDLPEGVRCKEQIEVYIYIPEMASRWMTVSTFDWKNPPEGVALQVVRNPVVEVWGPADIVNQLTAEEIVGIVDCTDFEGPSNYAPITYSVKDREYLYVRVDWNNVLIEAKPTEG